MRPAVRTRRWLDRIKDRSAVWAFGGLRRAILILFRMQYPEEHAPPHRATFIQDCCDHSLCEYERYCDSATDIVPDPWWRFCDNRPKLTLGGQFVLKQ